MPDPLYAAIASSIRQRLDGAAFQRCAVDLLRDAHYPGLRGTPPNNDTGIDGLSGPDDDPEFGLVATTAKDYSRNFRESVRLHLDASGAARAFVLATTQEVTVKSRQSLMRDAREEWGVRLRAIHDRGEFEQLLYRSPEWRKSLLGVTGSAQALSRFPASPRPSLPIPLIGRDADLARLRAEDGDIVLAGKPGVGKTFLLERLADEDWGLFDLGWSVSELKDAVLGMRPRRVVLDDAHLSPDRIAAVLQMRREMEADFSVVAVSWPGRADEVRHVLPDAKRIDVEELERDRIVEVIEAAGVADRDWQRLIADQADGRAGLAATLARACVAGRTREVEKGDVLLADLAGWYGRMLGAKSLHVLGVLALAGDRGATTEQVGDALRLDLAETGGLIAGLASGGTLGEAGGRRMNVQPADLRYPLVRDVFYGPGSPDPKPVVAAFDDPSSAALPLIGALHRGASVDREWLRSMIDWRDEQAAVEYALLGSSELREALARAPEHRTAIAGAAYRLGVDPEYALRVLMEEAVTCHFPEMSVAGEHPLDIVRKHLADFRTRPGARFTAAKVARMWLQDDKDSYVGVRVLTHAVQVELQRYSLDPGLGHTLELQRAAVENPAWIKPFTAIWASVIDAAERHPYVPIAPILEALELWILLERDWDLPDATTKLIRDTSARVIGRLAGIFRERPGTLHSLRVLARQREIAVRIDLPDDFAALYPVRDAINSVAEWDESERRWLDSVGRVADTFAERPIHEAAERLVFLAREADEAGIGWPPGARRLAQALAERTEEPEALLNALIEAGAGADLLASPLDRVTGLRRPGWETAIKRLLGSEATAGAAIRVTLVRPVGERLKRLAIREAAAWLRLIEELILRDKIGYATLALLFDAPDPDVARTAALTLAARLNERLDDIPPRLRPRWREIVADCPADAGDGGWVLGEILKQDDTICADWVRSFFERHREATRRYEPLLGVGAIIQNLPVDVRTALIADLPCSAPAFPLQDIVQSLIAGNNAAAAALFDSPECGKLHHLALQGDIGAEWMERALLALDRGWTPQSVVDAQRGSIESWAGSESEHRRQLIEAFKHLRPAPGQPNADRRTRIAEVGVAIYAAQRDDALRREREERVHGWR